MLDLSALAVYWLKTKNSVLLTDWVPYITELSLQKKKKRHLEEAIYYYFPNWLSQQ